jgi:ribosome-associated toxin RatA of RatAB toxin-antitoxin module
MTVFKKSRVVNYSCEQMFTLVNEVEHYPEFLPYCSQSVVHHRDDNEVQATLVIAAAGVNKSFTTRNHLQRNKMIEIRLVDGPFSHLEGFWRFDEEVDGACHISFDLEFEFAGHLFAKLLGPVFEQLTDKMVDAFCIRAEVLYGKR